MTGKSLFLFLGFLFFIVTVRLEAQNNDDKKVPVFSPVETSYNFGMIGENDGYAEHIFKFSNTGSAPLTILNVQTTCGCTRPDWTQGPVEPGKEGFIIITFNPKGRIGPLNKSITVQTNENDGYKRHKLTILGDVVEKPREPLVAFQDTVGGIGIEKKNLVFKSINASIANKIFVYIKNYNKETVYLSWENVPDYMTVQTPDSLKADWPGELFFVIDGSKTADKRGRITEKLTWVVKNREGRILGNENVYLTANYLDDFSKLSPVQTVSAPVLVINNTLLDFGTVKKSGIGKGKTVNKPIILTNTGKSDLIIHNITCDDERIILPDLKTKIIKVGESNTVNASIKPNEFNTQNLDSEIYVVCNDPKGPIRRIKVTAQSN